MTMLTTSEAAKMLGISPRRVTALIESGQVKAERFGRQWMVDEDSVRRRQQEQPRPGRRRMGEPDAANLSTFTLMNRNHPVLDFTYNHRTGEAGSIVPREGMGWKPLGIGRLDKAPNRYDLTAWLTARSIPAMRPNLPAALRAFNAQQPSSLMMDTWGLSLSDQYWFKPEGVEADWHEVNYFENGYREDLGAALAEGAALPPGLTAQGSPDLSTNGMLVKSWMRIDGVDVLVKGGTGSDNREPYNEVLATRLLARLLGSGEFVAYDLFERRGRAYSTCATMVDASTELIPAADVLTAFGITEGRDPHRGYLDALSSLGVPDASQLVDKMIVADHLMANFDRHAHNFGLVRNVEGLGSYRVAPLFDHGCGFYCRATLAELQHGRYLWESHPFREYPSQQLALVGDLSWYDPAALDGFEDDIAEVLGKNPSVDDAFIEAVQRQTARQVASVNDIAAERGLVVPGW